MPSRFDSGTVQYLKVGYHTVRSWSTLRAERRRFMGRNAEYLMADDFERRDLYKRGNDQIARRTATCLSRTVLP